MKNLIALFFLPTITLGQLSVDFVADEANKRVNVLIDHKPFTSYFYPSEDVLKKPVLYPILSANGNFITRGWPLDPRGGEREDHPHHVGLWLNNGNVNGNDFWNNSNARNHSEHWYGTIVHTGIEKMNPGKKSGELKVTADWKDHEAKILLKEETKYVFSGTEKRRVIDRTTTLTAKVPVLFADNKEGMFAIRLAKELELPDAAMPYKASGNYFNDFGVNGKDVWGKRSAWMNLTGEINSEKLSVAMFDHPDNENYPAHWHAREYGLYAINNIGSEVFTKGNEISDLHLAEGQKITFRYRLIIASEHLTEDEMIRFASEFSK